LIGYFFSVWTNQKQFSSHIIQVFGPYIPAWQFVLRKSLVKVVFLKVVWAYNSDGTNRKKLWYCPGHIYQHCSFSENHLSRHTCQVVYHLFHFGQTEKNIMVYIPGL